jgi:hypothetical protein
MKMFRYKNITLGYIKNIGYDNRPVKHLSQVFCRVIRCHVFSSNIVSKSNQDKEAVPTNQMLVNRIAASKIYTGKHCLSRILFNFPEPFLGKIYKIEIRERYAVIWHTSYSIILSGQERIFLLSDAKKY